MTEYYHVTTSYRGEQFVFTPNVPYYIQKGEDKRNARICVTDDWRKSLRSIIVLKRCKRLYVYGTTKEPVRPITQRELLIQEKKIRKNSNDFKLPRDGLVNNEKWYLEETQMEFKGMIVIPDEVYLGMIMAMGFSFGDPDVNKLELQEYKEEESIFNSMKMNKFNEVLI